MYKLSNLMKATETTPIHQGTEKEQWIPARPMNEDFKPLSRRILDAWLVFTGKASAFTWD